jgi:predicted MFS family arabinose efflux permease
LKIVFRKITSFRAACTARENTVDQASFVEVVMENGLMESKKAQDWLNLVLAAALFVSPWVLGFASETIPAWNAWIVGVLLAALAVAALSAFAEWEEWSSLVLGVWLIVSPWLLQFAANMNAMWTHVVLGALVAAVSAWALWDNRQNPHAHA